MNRSLITQSVKVAVVLLIGAGCTYTGKKLSKVQPVVLERNRELIQASAEANKIAAENIHRASAYMEPYKGSTNDAVLNTNQLLTLYGSINKADKALDLSTDFLTRAGALIGAPAENQKPKVDDLMSDNLILKKRAELAEKARMEQEAQWMGEKRELEQKLIEYGKKYEEERNKSIFKRFWLWTTGAFGLVGGIIFIVLCPAVAIPLLGRLLGWLVEVIPVLSSWIGVVSGKAFDAMVNGISAAKKKLNEQEVAVLETNLSKKMDKSHKLLVKVAKARNAVVEAE